MKFLNMFRFRGRISRKEYWQKYIITPIVLFLLVSFLGLLFVGVMQDTEDKELIGISSVIVFLISTCLAFLLICFSVTGSVKRYHDTDKSGLFGLVNFAPLILVIAYDPDFAKLLLMPNPLFTSMIASLFLLGGVPAGFFQGTEGSNRFGEDPLEKREIYK